MPLLDGYSSTTKEDVQVFRDSSAKFLRKLRKLKREGKQKELEKELAPWKGIIGIPHDDCQKGEKDEIHFYDHPNEK
ncbi:MAG: hypothetical protein RR719_06530 [Akkermansia sp.]